MPRIFDNIHTKFTEGLVGHLQTAYRVDYCAGYFNLRGWKSVVDGVDALRGSEVQEGNATHTRYCRLLVMRIHG
jgi:hypothetical protein